MVRQKLLNGRNLRSLAILFFYVTILMNFQKINFGIASNSPANDSESCLTPQQCLGIMDSLINFLRYPPDDVEEGFLEMIYEAYDEVSINLKRALICD